MSYIINDVNGYVGDLSTNTGLDYLYQYVEKKKKNNLIQFIDTGAALITKVLLREIESLKPKTEDLRDLIQNLKDIAFKSEIVMIITQ